MNEAKQISDDIIRLLVGTTKRPWNRSTDREDDVVVWGPGEDEFVANVGSDVVIHSIPSGTRSVLFDIDEMNADLVVYLVNNAEKIALLLAQVGALELKNEKLRADVREMSGLRARCDLAEKTVKDDITGMRAATQKLAEYFGTSVEVTQESDAPKQLAAQVTLSVAMGERLANLAQSRDVVRVQLEERLKLSDEARDRQSERIRDLRNTMSMCHRHLNDLFEMNPSSTAVEMHDILTDQVLWAVKRHKDLVQAVKQGIASMTDAGVEPCPPNEFELPEQLVGQIELMRQMALCKVKHDDHPDIDMFESEEREFVKKVRDILGLAKSCDSSLSMLESQLDHYVKSRDGRLHTAISLLKDLTHEEVTT